MEWYVGRFEREYRDAQTEFVRLSQMFNDVCWYNFETKCRNWKCPWRQSQRESPMELRGMRFTRKWNRGRLMEHGYFPVWYVGRIDEAPCLPPEIVLKELMDAKKYMDACDKQRTAPYDWAPGGDLYNELQRVTLVGKRYIPTTACVYTPHKRKYSSC